MDVVSVKVKYTVVPDGPTKHVNCDSFKEAIIKANKMNSNGIDCVVWIDTDVLQSDGSRTLSTQFVVTQMWNNLCDEVINAIFPEVTHE